MTPLPVAIVGLGPIGVEIARALAARSDVRLAAAVDLDPALDGKPLAERVPGAPDGVKISPRLADAIGGGAVRALALATSSRFEHVTRDLEIAIDAGVHVASTCEELAAPAIDPARWAALDERARRAGVTVIGTGVNPGFVMDRLVLQLAGACVRVERVTVERVVDAAKRRGPLRKKVGEGLTQAEFAVGVAERRLGHVGLRESAHLIARGLGWTLDGYEETIAPALGSDGRCLGIRQRGLGSVEREVRISLALDMFVGAPEPHDRVILDGDPPLDVLIAGGTQGDRGTVGTMVNALVRLPRAPRGLITVADVFC
ncbi:MAG TPA: dihydrodipicolinate reductase [Polyangia bacterium]|nr:dihydrodipicolinate reductase [Polyangia bacterium]